MKKTIDIIIKDKIAKLANLNAFIVCGNDNYEINFIFDEEWAEYEEKTVYFIANGVTLPPVVIQGNKCDVPALSNTTMLSVGVSAGDIRTTTDAVVSCRKSIRCKCGAPVAPTPEVYDQIMQMINDGKIKGETGEKGEKGDKGDAGSIKFLPVVELPTKNIDESAIYLLPIEGEDEQNRFTEYVYIDGKWEVIGAITLQVAHSEYVKFTDYATKTKKGIVSVGNGLQVNGAGHISILPAYQISAIDKRMANTVCTFDKIDYATMSALADCKDTTLWTDEKKASARALLGVDDLIAELRAEIAALKGV